MTPKVDNSPNPALEKLKNVVLEVKKDELSVISFYLSISYDVFIRCASPNTRSILVARGKDEEIFNLTVLDFIYWNIQRKFFFKGLCNGQAVKGWYSIKKEKGSIEYL